MVGFLKAYPQGDRPIAGESRSQQEKKRQLQISFYPINPILLTSLRKPPPFSGTRSSFLPTDDASRVGVLTRRYAVAPLRKITRPAGLEVLKRSQRTRSIPGFRPKKSRRCPLVRVHTKTDGGHTVFRRSLMQINFAPLRDPGCGFGRFPEVEPPSFA
jgi:hypothetical protein